MVLGWTKESMGEAIDNNPIVALLIQIQQTYDMHKEKITRVFDEIRQ